MNPRLLALALPLSLLSLVPPANAQAAAAVAAADPAVDPAYYRFYDAILGGFSIEQMASAGSDSLFDGLVRSQPRLAAMAKANPQFKADFRAAALPFMTVWMERSKALMRGRVAPRLAKYFTPAEASEIAGFYASPLGRKFMAALSSNMLFDATVDATIRRESVPGGIADADVDKGVGRALGKLFPTLTAGEREQMLQFSQRPVFAKLNLIEQAMTEIPQPTPEEFSTAEEREGFGKALRAVVAKATAGS